MTGASGSKATQVEANTRERAIERPTRWDALPERRLSTPYTRTRATRYRLSNFAPHAIGCDENEVCPGCGGQ